MRNFYQASKLPFALTSLCVLLSACGGGSNTINENPSAGGGTNTAVECASSDTSCVDLVFDDTPVVNLNYECGKYRGLTSNTGVARCPANSNVTFYLKTADGIRRIDLGSIAVKPVRNSISSEVQDTSLIRITPKDLAESVTGTGIASLDSSTGAAMAINISRLLQSIARSNFSDPALPYLGKNEPYIDDAPVNRVYIDPETKAGIEKLTENVTAKDFQDKTFLSKIQPWLDEQKITLISEAEAKRRLEKVILAKNSGIFYASPSLDSGLFQSTGVDLKLGVSGTGSNGIDNTASVAMFALTSRTGDSTGYGLEWVDKASDSLAKYTVYLKNKYSKMRLANDSKVFDPYTNRFSNFNFTVQPKAYTEGTNATTYAGNIFHFANGRLIRDLAVLGSADVYNLYNGETIKDTSELGTWDQKNTIGVTSFSGTASVFKRGAVNTYLDPAVWRVKQLVAKGETYQFPLYATLTINYRDDYTKDCDSCAKSETLPVAILANGDIVTDGSDASNYTNSTAMCGEPKKDSRGDPILGTDGNPVYVEQKLIGTIRAAFPSTTSNDYYISPSIVISGAEFGALDGTLIGIGDRVKINLAGVRNVNAGQRGSINATSAEPILDGDGNVVVQGIDNINPAIWANTYNSFTSLRVAYNAANEQATNPVKDIDPITPAEKRAANQDYGDLQISTSLCYTVRKKD